MNERMYISVSIFNKIEKQHNVSSESIQFVLSLIIYLKHRNGCVVLVFVLALAYDPTLLDDEEFPAKTLSCLQKRGEQ